MPHLHETPARPTVILLHASASSPRQWDRLAARLAPGWRVHAVELYGHGTRRPWPGHARFTLADEAGMLAPLLAQAGEAHLVGHSYGAAVALKLASLFPGKVRSITAFEPVLFRWLRELDGNDALYAQFTDLAAGMRRHLATGDAQAAARRFIDFWSGEGTWLELLPVRRDALAARMAAVLGNFDALFAEPMRPCDLARLGPPMLFMTGGATKGAMLRLAGVARRLLPDARHVALPGLDHMGPITGAERVNDTIAAYLAECEQGQRMPELRRAAA